MASLVAMVGATSAAHASAGCRVLRSLDEAPAARGFFEVPQVSIEEHEDRRIRTVRAVRRVDAPLAAVRDILTDHERLSDYSSSLRRAQILESEAETPGAQLRVRQELNLPFPLRDRFYILHVEDVLMASDCFESRWTSVPGSGNIEYTQGRWEILARGSNAVLLAYVAEADPGGWVPAFAANWAARRAVPEVLEKVAAAAEAAADR